MLANGIKQATSTTGTGALTLAPISGYPTIAQALPTIGVPVAYTILDAANEKFIEAGIGYLSSATTFVRARVTATFVGGAYAKDNPAPVNLSSASVLVVAPHAASLASAVPTIDTVSSGVNRLLTSARRTYANGAIATVLSRLYYVPFYLETAAPVTSLAVNCVTGAATATARAGIYACGHDGYPGALLAESGIFDLSTSGLKISTLAFPVSLPPGLYFVALGTNNANATLTFYSQGAANNLGGSPLGMSGTSQIEYRYESLAANWTNLPTVASTSTVGVSGSSYPMVFVGL